MANPHSLTPTARCRKAADWGLACRVTALLALILLAAPQALAGDPRSGRQLAEQWCTGCHLIGVSGRGSDTAPPFTAIAADPEKRPEDLETWLSTPHQEMPAMPLSRREIDDLVAYIGTLAP